MGIESIGGAMFGISSLFGNQASLQQNAAANYVTLAQQQYQGAMNFYSGLQNYYSRPATQEEKDLADGYAEAERVIKEVKDQYEFDDQEALNEVELFVNGLDKGDA